MKTLYLIGGTMGVGKTAVCQELKRMLVGSVFLDGDWCWDANPFCITDETKKMVVDNVCHILNNFLSCSAYEYVIFCWVMHKQEIIDGILNRLNVTDCAVKVVSLVCDERTLRIRLQKDIDNGIREANVIERSIERMKSVQQLATLKIDTTDMSIDEVARQILKI